MTPESSFRPYSGRRRLQFSVRILLLFVTLFCLVLTWWTVIYPELQHRKRDRIARDLERLSGSISQKWDQYIRIARKQDVEQSAFNRDRDQRTVMMLELETRGKEIENLQRAANTLAIKLQAMELKSAAGVR